MVCEQKEFLGKAGPTVNILTDPAVLLIQRADTKPAKLPYLMEFNLFSCMLIAKAKKSCLQIEEELSAVH